MTDLKDRYNSAKRALFDSYYSTLNNKQREAIYQVNGPLLILAGAGSGKTTVLVSRIAHILRFGDAYHHESVPDDLSEDKVQILEKAVNSPKETQESILLSMAYQPCYPRQILAFTFTNKAADELKNRLSKMIDAEEFGSMWVGTFHSICLRILRSNIDLIGFAPNFTVYDTEDTKRSITAVMKEKGIDDKNLPIRSVMNAISRAKDHLITPDDYLTEIGNDYRNRQISEIYAAYQKRLSNSNALDFDDIIMKTVLLLEKNESVRNYYQNKFKYVSVDEYQDTNKAQFYLVSLLSGGHQNIMVVGDDDQSIYKFRGATVENILGFDRSFKDAKVIKLEQNYRSTHYILEAANNVISNNEQRKGKNLWTNKENGEKIHISCLSDQSEESRFIATTISDLVSEGSFKYKDIALLYRNNAQSNSLEEGLRRSAIPYVILAGKKFAERKEIKDICAYLQVINNHSDKDKLWRIINEPKRKIGDKTIESIELIAEETGDSVFDVMKNADEYALLSRNANSLKDFCGFIETMTRLASETTLDVLYDNLIEMSGYKQMLIDDEKGKERLENLEEFKSTIVEYLKDHTDPSLANFLEENALLTDTDNYDETTECVTLMTVHAAKGLEFPVVFLCGMEEYLFPSAQSIDKGEEEVEEERRLAYVAITRAKEQVYITYTQTRILYGNYQFSAPSRFIKEIPEDCIQFEGYSTRKSYNNLSNKQYGVRTYIQNGSATNVQKEPERKRELVIYQPGDIVKHLNFGKGEILSVKPMGKDYLYEIAFENVGIKKIMASYARLTKL